MAVFGFDGLNVALSELANNWQRETSAARRIDAHAQAIVERAQAKIGTYQPATAGYPAWEQLAESTRAAKQRAGIMDDQPLLGVDEANHMRDDLTYLVKVDGEQVMAEIGIPDDAHSAPYAGVQELGSADQGRPGAIPERPFLRPAIAEEEESFVKEWDGVVQNWVNRAALRSLAAERAAGIANAAG